MGWIASLVALMASASFAVSSPPAEASTTNQTVHHASGRVAGEAWWNSGNHMAHAHGTSGFNAFTVADKVCDDGWAIGVEWQIDGQRHERRIPGDCEPSEITFDTGQATNSMRQFSWRVFMWDTNDISPTEYAPGFEEDWMGSDGSCDSRWVSRSTIYHDHEPNDPGTEHYTMTVWPEDAARVVGPGVGRAVWGDIQECTPLPGGFTEDQRESLYKQLVCHLAFARHSSLGGDTWDLESHRPNISWFRVLRGEDRCNWGGGGGSSD